MSLKEELESFRDGLIQQRDELLVQLNLAKMEARDDWDQAEEYLDQLKSKLDEVADETKEATDDVWTAANLLADEIKAAYSRIKQRL
jgi:uncharacterized protein (DUF342 family)